MNPFRHPLARASLRSTGLPRPLFYRQFHACSRTLVVKPFPLADIGEGITEVQLIQWFVQPGARVEQFDKLCEVQSDKASVEITSPFEGVVKKLYYEPDDMAITGKPLVDIDIQGEISEEDEKMLGGVEHGEAAEERDAVEAEGVGAEHTPEAEETTATRESDSQQQSQKHPPRQGNDEVRTLATPAVRHLVREHKLDVADIEGTGKDGRVMKEDVHRHVSQKKEQDQDPQPQTSAPLVAKEDRRVPLTSVQSQMFKAMTRSLNIPHFLYTSTADMTAITALRKKLNASASPEQKLTHLAFILKALSIALLHHPILNASLDTTKDPKKPQLTYRAAHNFGIAIDTPSGLLVPVVKNVQALSISNIAGAMRSLSTAARNNKLSPPDFSGASFTVSNIGSIGGGVVAPVISEPQVAIVGVGRSKVVPAFDEDGKVIAKEELVLSWSADHRVVDGAECARCAERVRGMLEEPERMVVELQ